MRPALSTMMNLQGVVEQDIVATDATGAVGRRPRA
jgi:hypothetical protein